MRFEWDSEKEQRNIEKHGIDFGSAVLIFGDPNRIEIFDDVHSDDEERYLTIGIVKTLTVIVTVIYTERVDTVRIISARIAAKSEKEAYYEGHKRN